MSEKKERLSILILYCFVTVCPTSEKTHSVTLSHRVDTLLRIKQVII